MSEQTKLCVLSLAAAKSLEPTRSTTTLDLEDFKEHGELEFIRSATADYLPKNSKDEVEVLRATSLFYRASNTGKILKFGASAILFSKVFQESRVVAATDFSEEAVELLPSLLDLVIESGKAFTFPAVLKVCHTAPKYFYGTDILRYSIYSYALVATATAANKDLKPWNDSNLMASIKEEEQSSVDAAAPGHSNRRPLQSMVLFQPTKSTTAPTAPRKRAPKAKTAPKKTK